MLTTALSLYSVPLEKIFSFRRKYRAELLAFRDLMDAFEKHLAKPRMAVKLRN